MSPCYACGYPILDWFNFSDTKTKYPRCMNCGKWQLGSSLDTFLHSSTLLYQIDNHCQCGYHLQTEYLVGETPLCPSCKIPIPR